MTKSLNDLQEEYYFSLSTLATSPLKAYSRISARERSSFCRNTSISSYKINIDEFLPDSIDQKRYVESSVRLMQSLLERYESLETMCSIGDDALSKDFSLSGITSAKILSSLGLFGEYYYDIYEKIVTPVKSAANRVDDDVMYDGLDCVHEHLSDEGAIIDGFKEAISIVIDDAQKFAEHLNKFITNQKGLKIAGEDIGRQVSNIMKVIEDIGKENRKVTPK